MSWIQAKKHYYEFGFNEGRLYECERGAISKCAAEGNKCQCNGMVFYAPVHNHGSVETTPNTENSFSQAIQYAFRQENPGNNQINCNNHRFGDVAPGRAKQCFCEAPIPRNPKACGNEGQNCRCPGRGKVFYGAKSTSTNPHATFKEIVETPYLVK